MNEESNEDFGVRLKTLREQRGLSMMAFGTAIGTSASRIKAGKKEKMPRPLHGFRKFQNVLMFRRESS